MTARFLLVTAALLGLGSACPDEQLCANLDCGSCGNACCKLEIVVNAMSTEAVMSALNASIHKGGADGSYRASIMNGAVTTGFSDLRPYNVSADFLGQAIHTTNAPNYYNDTIDLAVAPKTDAGPAGTVIRAFSISQVGGAYCDAGQNYYNIMKLVSSIEWSSGYYGGDAGLDGSCPTATVA